MAAYDYDLIAIGAGTAGLTVTRLLAARGKHVALVEEDRPGGDCLWTGCVPTKALLHSAKLLWDAKHAGPIRSDRRRTLASISPPFALMCGRPRTRPGRIDSADAIAANGVELIKGRASFVDDHTVEIDSRRLTAATFVIATGSEPTIPPIPGLPEADPETNVEALSWEDLPQSLCIIGGGPIGLEFAQMMNRFGVTTTIVEALPRILSSGEPSASEVVAEVLRREGVTIHTASPVSRVETAGDRKRICFKVENKEYAVVAERILVATGRRPRVEGLALEVAGVEFSPAGVPVDRRLRTSKKHIYALGDVKRWSAIHARCRRPGARRCSRDQWLSDVFVERTRRPSRHLHRSRSRFDRAQRGPGQEGQPRRQGIPDASLGKLTELSRWEQETGSSRSLLPRGWNRWLPRTRRLMGDPIVGATLVGPGAGELLG